MHFDMHFKRQCWIFFGPEESTFRFTAENPPVGLERIIAADLYSLPEPA